MPFRQFGLALVLCLIATAAAAGNFDINVGSNVVRGDLSEVLPTGLTGDIGWLHNSHNGDIGHIGFGFTGNANPVGAPFKVYVGPRLIYINPDHTNADGGALGLGGTFRWTWPTYNRLALGGQVYYAPSVTSFAGATHYLEYGVRLDYSILRAADVYVGWRRINVDFHHHNDMTIDDGFVGGLTFHF
jgi:hypothetical protein